MFNGRLTLLTSSKLCAKRSCIFYYNASVGKIQNIDDMFRRIALQLGVKARRSEQNDNDERVRKCDRESVTRRGIQSRVKEYESTLTQKFMNSHRLASQSHSQALVTKCNDST